jgi:hypothetical protein
MGLNRYQNDHSLYIGILNTVLNDELKLKRIRCVSCDRLGNRNYAVEFSGNVNNGAFNVNSKVTLYDPFGYEINDIEVINNYLLALTKKINDGHLIKKDSFFSDGFNNFLIPLVNQVEDAAKGLVKFGINRLIVGNLAKAIDYFTGFNIHQKLKEKRYFDCSNDTKGFAKIFDPSYIGCKFPCAVARIGLRFADYCLGKIFKPNPSSHYFPLVNQSDIDEIARKKNTTKKKGSSKGISDGHEAHTTPARSKSLPARPRPHPQASNKKSNSVGQTPSPYWTPQTDHKPHDPFSSYQNFYKPSSTPYTPTNYKNLITHTEFSSPLEGERAIKSQR